MNLTTNQLIKIQDRMHELLLDTGSNDEIGALDAAVDSLYGDEEIGSLIEKHGFKKVFKAARDQLF